MADRGAGFGGEATGAERFLGALREHWLLIAAFVAVALIAAAAYVETATPRYRAEADVLVTPVSGSEPAFLGFSLLQTGSDPTQAVLTAGRLVTTPAVAAEAAKRGGNPIDRAFAGVTVTPVTQSSLVAVAAESSNPATAARVANAVANGFIAARTAQFQAELNTRLRRLRAELAAIPPAQRSASAIASALEGQLGTLASLTHTQDPTLQLIAGATPPTSPVYPRKALSLALAIVAALVLGVGLALALEFVSPRITREDELVLEQRLPILARVPKMSTKAIGEYMAGTTPLPAAAREAYRTLRASLTSGAGDLPRTIVVTSASPGEGKTMTSVNLATTLAGAGHRVILVDGDLRRPMVATMFGVATRQNGFAQLLLGRVGPDEALVEAAGYGEGLRLLLSSPDYAHVVDLLDAHRVEGVLAELRGNADVVVVDSAPLGEVADTLALADASDAVIVAVRLGRTRRDRLAELRRLLARHGISPVGFVVTQRRRAKKTAYGYYGAGEQADASAPEPLRHPEAV